MASVSRTSESTNELCHLYSLKGDRIGQHAISINDQWRICFRFVDEDAFDVEICDYH